jgi:hypothetical protein
MCKAVYTEFVSNKTISVLMELRSHCADTECSGVLPGAGVITTLNPNNNDASHFRDRDSC